MPHENLDMDAGQSHLTSSAVGAIPAELNFHLLSYVDTAAAAAATDVSPQPTVEYFFGGADQPPVQFEQLAATNHQAMSMLRDYYGQYPAAAETYLRGGSSSLVFGAADDESAYMVGPFESSPKPRTSGGGRKRRRGTGGFHGGPNNGVEKKEKQRRMRLSEKFTALMHLIPNRTKVCHFRSLFLLLGLYPTWYGHANDCHLIPRAVDQFGDLLYSPVVSSIFSSVLQLINYFVGGSGDGNPGRDRLHPGAGEDGGGAVAAGGEEEAPEGAPAGRG